MIGKLASVLLLGMLFAQSDDRRLQQPPTSQTKVYSPQIVLVFDHKNQDGILVVVPKGTVVFGLRPLGQKAPLGPNSYLICHPYQQVIGIYDVDGVKRGPYNNIGFRCGEDEYVLEQLDIQQ